MSVNNCAKCKRTPDETPFRSFSVFAGGGLLGWCIECEKAHNDKVRASREEHRKASLVALGKQIAAGVDAVRVAAKADSKPGHRRPKELCPVCKLPPFNHPFVIFEPLFIVEFCDGTLVKVNS